MVATRPWEPAAPPPPPTLPGFGHINRYWDRVHEIHAAKILPGEYYVTTGGEMISTVLGSCVAACIRDPLLGVGGMNHFLLPLRGRVGPLDPNDPFDVATRYGNHAMESLINAVIALGGRRERMEVKLFGGGSVIPGMTSDVGKKNVQFAEEYLHNEGLRVLARDVLGPYPRKVQYFPESGRARCKKLYQLQNRTVQQREDRLAETLQKEGVHGEVDLF